MNGDVYSRAEADELIKNFGVDGAMIATAAETNPSCFRPASQGGKAPWEEVIKDYVKTAMEVENRWGNTKYLLGQMIPGKSPYYKAMTVTKSYSELIKTLGYENEPEFIRMAKEMDELLELGAFEKPKLTKAERKKLNKEAAKQEESARGEADPEVKKKTNASAANKKRTAEQAELGMPPDAARDAGPAIVQEQASVLTV